MFAGLLQSSKQKRFALAAMFVESLSLEGQWTLCLFGTVAFAMMAATWNKRLLA